ncbi:hypothetical protein GXW74_06620 [Roseomonas eburnea]|uniref:Uncharacterized protein n=1 Tax=Neoroseomonas eburnea TaxID=1346889 RepID=A0A9X9X8W7_9PROT|nr:hypothetical protein [Neoroseomonas eburnea]MBR0680153.1 hypothetical protein [Neoroseomonas eburnea]
MTIASTRPALLLLAGSPLLSGCIGSDRIAFATVDNIGIAIESTPYPYVDIGFSRTEGVVQPVFEDGRVSAVAAAGAHDVPVVAPLSVAHVAVFAGGPAAASVARASAPADAPTPGTRGGADAPPPAEDRSAGAACIRERPTGWDGRQLPENGRSNPLIFSTTTSIGFRIGLPPQNATSGVPVPNVHLGYRRAEVAVAPVFGQPGGCSQALAGSAQPNTYQVNSPNFIGVFRSGQATAAPQPGAPVGGSFNVGQVFATGAAAGHVARTVAVRNAWGDVITPATGR